MFTPKRRQRGDLGDDTRGRGRDPQLNRWASAAMPVGRLRRAERPTRQLEQPGPFTVGDDADAGELVRYRSSALTMAFVGQADVGPDRG
jgi:hypothetical protein